MLGRLGLEEDIEPRIRRLTAERAGVAPEGLHLDAELEAELHIETLDLIFLAIAIERELGIVLPERALRRVRSYRDLVDTAVGIVSAEPYRVLAEAGSTPLVRTRVRRDPEAGRLTIERTAPLTPYTVQAVSDDVRRAGPGAILEVMVSGADAHRAVARARALFSRLEQKGVEVRVRAETDDGSVGAR
jgi:acyl carrier protein